MKTTKGLWKKGMIFVVIGLFIGASIVPSISSDEPISKGTIYVDGDADPSWYDATHVKTIQEGISNASSGDTVYVYNGTYYENIELNKSIDLTGENRSNTIIDGNGIMDVINVLDNWTNISRFTIQNSGFNYLDSGIKILSSFNNFSENIITSCMNGIHSSSSNNTISTCDIFNNTYGIDIEFSENNLITQCNIYNHSGGALSFAIRLYSSQNNKITDCNISNVETGIYLTGSSQNTILNCNISNNNYGYGFYFLNSNNNKMYHNNFINNSQNAYDNGHNTWDDGYPSGGNYWDDYTGSDVDADGIGDTPYNIPAGTNQDLYPLIYPFKYYNTSIIYVDDNFNNTTIGWNTSRFNVIQNGIDAVAENGIVYVYNGIYYENLMITAKKINLIGEDKNNTIINASGNNNGVVISYSSNKNLITGFTISNAGEWPYTALRIISHNNTIRNNITGVLRFVMYQYFSS